MSVSSEADERSVRSTVRLLTELRHPSILSYFGHDETEAIYYVRQEFMSGGSVAALLHDCGPLPEDTIAAYAYQILDGLGYLHTRTPVVLHGDLKCANVLIGCRGNVKLSGFHCFRQLEDMHSEFAANCGTIAWMAPEVIRQEVCGTWSDVWSLGCAVIEMATAKQPWGSFDNVLQAMVHIGMSDRTPPLPSNVSAACQEFIRDCTRRDVKSRPSVAELHSSDFVPATTIVQLSAALAEDGVVNIEGTTIDGGAFANLRVSLAECTDAWLFSQLMLHGGPNIQVVFSDGRTLHPYGEERTLQHMLRPSKSECDSD